MKIEEHIGLVRSVVARMGVARGHRDDAVQEGCLALVRVADQFDPARAAWSTFASGVIRNAVRHYMRTERNAASRVAGLAAATTEGMMEQGPATLPEASPVARAMATLSERDRLIVTLRSVEGLTLAETATRVGMSVSGTQKAEMAALETLRKALG